MAPAPFEDRSPSERESAPDDALAGERLSGKTEDSAIIVECLAQLQDDDPQVCLEAIKAMPRAISDEPPAVRECWTAALQRALAEDSPIRREAARALENKIGWESSAIIPQLVTLAADRTAETRVIAIVLLGQIMSDPERIVLEEEIICDGSQRAVMMARAARDRFAAGIRERGIPQPLFQQGLETLIAAVRDPVNRVRAVSMTELFQVGPRGAAAVPFVLEWMADPDFEFMPDCCRVLAEMEAALSAEQAEQALPLLQAFLESKDYLLLEDTIYAIGRIGLPAATMIPRLIEFLEQDRSEEQGFTEYAKCYKLQAAPQASPELKQALRLTHCSDEAQLNQGRAWGRKRVAAWALGRMGARAIEAVSSLLDVLQDAQQERRFDAAVETIVALRRIAPEEAETRPEVSYALSYGPWGGTLDSFVERRRWRSDYDPERYRC